MKCKPCTYSQEQEEGFSLTSYSDTDLSLQSSGINTPAKFSENEQQTDGSLICQCGKGTLDCLIHPSTPEKWIASMQDSHARILVSLENKLELAKKHEADCIGKSSASLTWLDQTSYSWKTYQQSFLTGWELFSQTFPRGGILHDGYVYELPMLARIMEGIGGGCLQEKWATPNTLDSMPPKSPEALNREITVTRPGRSKPSNLRDQVSNMQNWPTPTRDSATERTKKYAQGGMPLTLAVKIWPTPQASDNRDRGNMSDASIKRRIAIGKQIGLSTVVKESKGGGSLNPTWTEWLMGWPLEWTDLKL